MKRFIIILFAILLLISGCAPANLTQPPTITLTPPSPDSQEQIGAVKVEPSSTPPVSLAQSPKWKGFPEELNLIALIRLDGNVWLVDAISGAGRQITQDGNGTPLAGAITTEMQWIYYDSISWSSDGKLLAFRRTIFDNTASENKTHIEVWIYDIEGDQAKVMLTGIYVNSLAFRPGTHLLAYDEALDASYFATGSGGPDASKARGIMGLNVDTGETGELVKPEHGLWLSEPHWSPDGNILGFVEQRVFEDPAPFGLYDFQNKAYTAWNKVIGEYVFAPDGRHIAYDRLSNGGFSGNERIWVSDLEGMGEQVLSPRDGPAAHGPAWSPKGDLLVYKLGEPELSPADSGNILVVQPAEGGEARQLDTISFMGTLVWSPDGTRLAYSTGPHDQPLLNVVTIADGSIKELGNGYDPAWQPSTVR